MLWCILSLQKYITKESDPMRQIYYTTKITRLVDFINIFVLTLKLVPYKRQKHCFCWFYPAFVQAFFIRHYRKIPECFLLCLFLCQSGLFQIYECYSFHGIKTDSRPAGITTGFSVH